MKTLMYTAAFACFALSSLGAAGEAKASEPAGHSFCVNGIGDPDQLAAKIERSLAADSRGGQKVEGCYANPAQFLEGFQESDSDEGLTSVSQLPAYLRKLRAAPVDRTIEYGASCIRVNARGQDVVIMNCVVRHVRPGEDVYQNPDTGRIVLWEDCGNPGFVEFVEEIVVNQRPCLEIRAPSMGVGTSIRGAYIGRHMLTGRCNALLLAGETERRHDLPEECEGENGQPFQKTIGDRRVTVICSWDDDEAAVSEILGYRAEVQNVSYSYVARAEGTNVWYLPPDALDGEAVICWEMADGTYRTVGVRAPHYVNGVATITPADVRAAVWNQ